MSREVGARCQSYEEQPKGLGLVWRAERKTLVRGLKWGYDVRRQVSQRASCGSHVQTGLRGKGMEKGTSVRMWIYNPRER